MNTQLPNHPHQLHPVLPIQVDGVVYCGCDDCHKKRLLWANTPEPLIADLTKDKEPLDTTNETSSTNNQET